jgi:hypothetical protein
VEEPGEDGNGRSEWLIRSRKKNRPVERIGAYIEHPVVV